jgi:DNA polymerase III subunit alpha
MSSNPPTKEKIYPLHCHTAYSLLDGVSTVKEYVKYCKEHEIEACSCTDHGYVMGLYDLISESEKEGIKGICGVEAYLHPGAEYVFALDKKKFDYFHLTLWAANETGYRTLLELSNVSWGDGRIVSRWGNLKPRITWEDLEENNAGLFCGSGCIEGPIVKPYLRGEKDMANLNANRLIDIFDDRLFMEVMPHKVNKNWVSRGVVEVRSTSGVRFLFDKRDILITNLGDITAEEAMKKGVTEIYGSKTNRPQKASFGERNVTL